MWDAFLYEGVISQMLSGDFLYFYFLEIHLAHILRAAWLKHAIGDSEMFLHFTDSPEANYSHMECISPFSALQIN